MAIARVAARDPRALERVQRRIGARAVMLGHDDSEFVICPYPGEPRWRVDDAWIEFECGCRAERCAQLQGQQRYDPVVFGGLPEQAVYDFVCHDHKARMNFRCTWGGFVDFDQWYRDRRRRLMGRAG